MTSSTVKEIASRNRMTRLLWLSFVVFTAVFFVTSHNILHNRYSLERTIIEFNPTEEEAVELMLQFESGQLTKALAYFALGAFGVISLMLQGRNRIKPDAILGTLVTFFVIWTLLSILWAENQSVTLNKIIQFAMLCAGALAVAHRFSDRDIIFFVVFSTGIYLLLGIGSEIALNTFRPWTPGYRFSGTCHPNGQGLNCALLLMASVFLAIRDEKHRLKFLVVALAASAFLILTKSRTPIAGLIMVGMIYLFIRVSRKRKIVLASAVVVLVCATIVFYSALQPAFVQSVTFGRIDVETTDASKLSGRIDLWRECLEYISERPLFGYGYNSFWTAERTFDLADAVGWMSGSAHSIYFELLLGTGIIGLLLYAVINFSALRRCLIFQAHTGDVAYGFLWCILLFTLFHGTAESALLFPCHPTFVSMAVLARLAFREALVDEAQLP